MKQQFIGLKHCKCGTSWQKGVGYFQRTSDMVFALERKVIKKGKNSVRTKQVPVIRSKEGMEANKGAMFGVCKDDILKVNGCKPSVFIHDGNVMSVSKSVTPGTFSRTEPLIFDATIAAQSMDTIITKAVTVKSALSVAVSFCPAAVKSTSNI
jgi:hypothetical protein